MQRLWGMWARAGGAKHRRTLSARNTPAACAHAPTILACLCILITASTPAPYKHDFHLSTTEVTQNPTAQKTEWLIRVFQDDLELALQKQFATKIDLQQQTLTNDQLKKYFNKHLLVKRSNQTIAVHYLGYELQEQSCWLYLETNIVKLPITVRATWLQELYDDQKNLLRFQFSESRTFYTATNESPEIHILK